MRTMWTIQVVVDSPVLDEDLGFEEGIEAVPVEEFVTQATVERFDPGVLPGRSGVDEDGPGAVEAAPVGHSVGDELRAVEFLREVKPLLCS
jgi:hypothetical protein